MIFGVRAVIEAIQAGKEIAAKELSDYLKGKREESCELKKTYKTTYPKSSLPH